MHKPDCESPLRSESWLPRWAVEDRQPTWLVEHGSNAGNVQQASVKYLWGNMPALNVLNLRSNEGESFSEDIKLLFAGEWIYLDFSGQLTHTASIRRPPQRGEDLCSLAEVLPWDADGHDQ